jgi:hypothetical protein
MAPIADNPVIAPDRELEEDKKPGASELPRIRCPLCGAGHRAKKTNGSAPAALSGTLSTRDESAQPASKNGLKPSAFRAVGGRLIRSGMPMIDSSSLAKKSRSFGTHRCIMEMVVCARGVANSQTPLEKLR